MKRTSKTIVFFLAIFTLSWIATGNAATQYVWDANTLVLDHFNDSTTASYVGGSPTYVDSAPGLDRAIKFTQGTFAMYGLPAWNSSSGGTVEAWVTPITTGQGGQNYATFQWFNTTTQPQDGYVGSLYQLPATGKFTWGAWVTGGLTSNRTIPLNQRSHVALTWGPTGTDFYVNGQLDAHTDTNAYPIGPMYLYINAWGNETGSYVMDELRISNIARTEFTTVPLPPTVLLLGSGLLGLVGLRRFRKV